MSVSQLIAREIGKCDQNITRAIQDGDHEEERLWRCVRVTLLWAVETCRGRIELNRVYENLRKDSAQRIQTID